MYYIYIDEAGRGPIAGPVYVGLVLEYVNDADINYNRGGLFKTFDHTKLFDKYSLYRDSKTIDETEREYLYETIVKNKKIIYSPGSSSSTEVDRNGIVRGVRWAIVRGMFKLMKSIVKEDFMKQGCYAKRVNYALDFLKDHGIKIILDGKVDYGLRKMLGVEVETIIKGDAKIPMISAASIIAKVERDRFMRKLHLKYPQYEFDAHKGYGTKKHYALIAQHGLSKEHRKSWIK